MKYTQILVNKIGIEREIEVIRIRTKDLKRGKKEVGKVAGKGKLVY